MEGHKNIIFALDIETRGMSAKHHGILSIGICIGSADEEKVLFKTRFDLKPLVGQTMEQRCHDEFWAKHQDLYAELTKAPMDAKSQMGEFRQLLDQYHSSCDSVYIVSDNPTFDFGIVNYYLQEFGHLPLSYKRDESGKLCYVPLHDSDSYARGAMRYGFSEQWLSDEKVIKNYRLTLSKEEMHNHFPENDAEFIYRMHFQLVNSPLI